MISFKKENNRFNFRVAGIALYQGKILLHTTWDLDYWVLPGGRVEFQETTNDCLVREMREEVGVDVKINRLSYVHEYFNHLDNEKFHELGFYYLMSLPENHEILLREGEFNGVEDGNPLIFKWFQFEELDQIEVYPDFIKRDIYEMTSSMGIKHEITEGLIL